MNVISIICLFILTVYECEKIFEIFLIKLELLILLTYHPERWMMFPPKTITQTCLFQELHLNKLNVSVDVDLFLTKVMSSP